MISNFAAVAPSLVSWPTLHRIREPFELLVGQLDGGGTRERPGSKTK
jgi:hypothetical protein